MNGTGAILKGRLLRCAGLIIMLFVVASCSDSPREETIVQETESYSIKKTEQGGNAAVFSYNVYRNGNITWSLSEVLISGVAEFAEGKNWLELRISDEEGGRRSCVFDKASGELLSIFPNVLALTEDRIAYADRDLAGTKLVVREVLNADLFYKEIVRDYAVTDDPGEAFSSVTFIDSESIEFQYVSRENGPQSETIDFLKRDPLTSYGETVILEKVLSEDGETYQFAISQFSPFFQHPDYPAGITYCMGRIDVYNSDKSRLVAQVYEPGIYSAAWGRFFVEDINFDGYSDIVVNVARASNSGDVISHAWIWNNNSDSSGVYVYADSFNMVNAAADPAAKTIRSYRRDAQLHVWELYGVMGSQFFIKAQLVSDIESGQIYEEVLVDGAWVRNYFDDGFSSGLGSGISGDDEGEYSPLSDSESPWSMLNGGMVNLF